MFIHADDRAIIKKLNLKHPSTWLATWFGAGFFRPGPGTWGSAAAIPPALIIYAFTGVIGLVVAALLIFAAGLWAAKIFDEATDGHDSKMIVIDEVVGQWIALMPGLIMAGLNPPVMLLAFLLFRLFDITKPWPISWLDRNVSGAMGVMIDDVAAGIAAAACLTGIVHYAGIGY